MIKVVSLYTDLRTFGGAQKVLANIHLGLKKEGCVSMVSSFDKWEEVNGGFKEGVIDEGDYFQFSLKFLFQLKKQGRLIIFTHHRKMTTLLLLFKYLFAADYQVVHVAHNQFYSKKAISFFPSRNIAVSHAVKENLVNYFKIKEDSITVIHNGLIDLFQDSSVDNKKKRSERISILYPARINNVKQQLEIVNQLSDKLPENIIIKFVGIGPDYEKLKELTNNNPNFKVLGFKKDMKKYYQEADFVMLYSLHEGLPLSLIEATMYKTPIICNSVGGNEEIVKNGVNGFICNNFNSLTKRLLTLRDISNEEYLKMARYSRQIFEGNFEYHLMIKKYIDFIDSVRD